MLASKFSRSLLLAGCRNAGSVATNPNTTMSKVRAAVKSLPMREAVRYTHKNMKWTADNFYSQVQWHANALHDLDYRAGENIGIWLHDCAEKHVTMTAAARLGLNIVDINVEDINDVPSLRKALKAANVKYLFFSPEVEDVSNHLYLLRKAIPEFYEYDDTAHQQFHSKHFPSLSTFIHTGLDVEMGAWAYRELFLPHCFDNYVEAVEPTVDENKPFYHRITKGADGEIVVGQSYTRAQILELPEFYFLKNLIDHKYFEV